MLMTVMFHCVWRSQEEPVLLWKDGGKEDQASHWLGQG